MTSANDVAGLCAGPCVICGGTNYRLSCGGPTICPKCDCGQFDAATVLQQAKVIAGLRSDLESQANALREMEAERDRLSKRLDLLAVGFGVCDGGKYIADWQTKIAKYKSALAAESERDTLRARLKEAEKVIEPLACFAKGPASDLVKHAKAILPSLYDLARAARAFDQGGK